jgi:RNA polymerase sigma-70 factor (ECF subfamily)
MSAQPAEPVSAPAAIEAVYRERLARFRRVAAAIVGDREQARDVVQDAFATALRRAHSFRGDGSIEAWLWQIVLNSARNQRRRRSTTSLAGIPEAAQPAPSQSNGELARAVASLPERQREILFLRYYADLDYRSIAEALQIAEGTVAATLNAAHAALRKQLIQEVER